VSTLADHLKPFHQDSFYLYDREIFKQNLDDFLNAFRIFYPQTQVALSVKTNYLIPLLRDALSVGCWFEVVSLAEYLLVRSLGIPAIQIVVNGPAKHQTLISQAIREGALLQLDGPEEIALLKKQIHTYSDVIGRVGLRCSLQLAGEDPSRFGFDVTDSSWVDAINALEQMPNIHLESLHCHYCSSTRQTSDYQKLLRALIKLTYKLPGSHLKILNLGGGFLSPANKDFQRQFPFPWVTFEEYGKAIGEVLAEYYTDLQGPTLLLEPGLAVTANCISFFARITGIKTLRGRILIQVAGSCYNIKPNKSRRNLTACVISRNNESKQFVQGAEIVGYTCMEDDILHRDFSGELGVGDYIRFDQVGAYSITLKPPFIEPQAPVYARNPMTDDYDLIQGAESWQEMFGVVRSIGHDHDNI
jgi:diaminopimelate decarboxylase